MVHRIDRAMLESVFPAEEIVALSGDALDVILDQETREFLREVGLPDGS
jgi:hypothetical protein